VTWKVRQTQPTFDDGGEVRRCGLDELGANLREQNHTRLGSCATEIADLVKPVDP